MVGAALAVMEVAVIPLPLIAGLPWRAIGWTALVAAVALMGWRVSAWREAYKTLPEVEAALEAEVACTPESQCGARQAKLQADAEAKSAEVVANYERELEELRNRPLPHRVIRVCNDRGLQSPGAAGTADGAAPDLVRGADEFDTRPLRELAREADEVAARLKHLQEWNRALSAN